MRTKQIITVLAVLTMILSSVFVIASTTNTVANDNADVIDVKDLTGDTYWIKATENASGYYILESFVDRTPCIVRISADSICDDSELIIGENCGFIVERGHILGAKKITMNGGNISCEGSINTSGIDLVKGTNSEVSLTSGGQIFPKQGIVLPITCGSSKLELRKLSSIECDTTISAPNNGSYDLLLKEKGSSAYWAINTSSITIGNERVALDCNLGMVSNYKFDGNAESRLYLRNDGYHMFMPVNESEIRCVRPLSEGTVYIGERSITSTSYTYKIDDKGNVTKGYMLMLNATSRIDYNTRYGFGAIGEKIDLYETFGISPTKGYEIVGFKWGNIDSYSTVKIDDPKNFECTKSGVIYADVEEANVTPDWTGFWIGAIILLILAILAPIGAWYFKDKYCKP